MTPMAAVKGISAGDLIAYALRSVRIATLCLEPANSGREQKWSIRGTTNAIVELIPPTHLPFLANASVSF